MMVKDTNDDEDDGKRNQDKNEAVEPALLSLSVRDTKPSTGRRVGRRGRFPRALQQDD